MSLPCRFTRVCDTALSLRALQPLAEAVFGAGSRAPGWFARKLVREAVDPRRSFLAFGTGPDPIGYFLLGDEPGESVAHCAGLGVVEEHRGRGVGSALVEYAAASLRGVVPALQILSEPPLLRFYERVGFVAGRVCHTMQTAGTGPRTLDLDAHPPGPWTLPGRAVAGWRAGTWSRTPATEAATVSLAGGVAWAHLSREGRAILVQRLCVTDGDGDAKEAGLLEHSHAALDDLRGRLGEGTPLLLYGCEAVSCVTAALLRDHRWRLVQTAVEVQRELAGRVDKHAAPAA